MSWMQRLKRVFAVDIETCPDCSGKLEPRHYNLRFWPIPAIKNDVKHSRFTAAFNAEAVTHKFAKNEAPFQRS
jgi:hypothetical protein